MVSFSLVVLTRLPALVPVVVVPGNLENPDKRLVTQLAALAGTAIATLYRYCLLRPLVPLGPSQW